MKDMKEGDHVFVAAGRYDGQAHAGTMPQITVGNFTLEGGWTKDFSSRDPFKNLTEIAPPPRRARTAGR